MTKIKIVPNLPNQLTFYLTQIYMRMRPTKLTICVGISVQQKKMYYGLEYACRYMEFSRQDWIDRIGIYIRDFCY